MCKSMLSIIERIVFRNSHLMTYCQSKELQNTDKNNTVLYYSYYWLKVEKNNTHTHLLLKSLVGEEKRVMKGGQPYCDTQEMGSHPSCQFYSLLKSEMCFW